MLLVATRIRCSTVDAYTRGLNMEQLIALGNQKYTAEQIYNKLKRAGVVD